MIDDSWTDEDRRRQARNWRQSDWLCLYCGHPARDHAWLAASLRCPDGGGHFRGDANGPTPQRGAQPAEQASGEASPTRGLSLATEADFAIGDVLEFGGTVQRVVAISCGRITCEFLRYSR